METTGFWSLVVLLVVKGTTAFLMRTSCVRGTSLLTLLLSTSVSWRAMVQMWRRSLGKGYAFRCRIREGLRLRVFLRLSSWILKMLVLSHIAAFCIRTMVAWWRLLRYAYLCLITLVADIVASFFFFSFVLFLQNDQLLAMWMMCFITAKFSHSFQRLYFY